jgi:hypothetical protein
MLLIRGVAGLILDPKTDYLTEDFVVFVVSIQANTGIVKFNYDHFLSYSFPLTRRSYHLAQSELLTASLNDSLINNRCTTLRFIQTI